MSTTPPPRSPGPTNSGSTRQLLDELDALMQRMLALPVNQLDDEATPPAAAEDRGARTEIDQGPMLRQGPAAPAHDARPSLEAPGGRKLVAHPPAALFPQLPHRTEAPPPEGARPERFTPPDEPAVIIPPVEESARPALAPPIPAPTPPVPAALPRPSVRPAPPPRLSPARPPVTVPRAPAPTAPPMRRRTPEWVMRALLWSNRAFDRWTGWLGQPGRWLRGPLGRSVLGWFGLGLWAVALMLVLLRFLR